VALIRSAAEQSGIDWVFVDSAIKPAVCRIHTGAPWLRRIRPWSRHDSHMHFRLRCRLGEAECHDQPRSQAAFRT
jgi:penicillin-insensitive murein endopeptidase